MTAPANHYFAYGLRWRSELALPFRPGDAACRADVTVRSGDVADASALPGARKGVWSHDSSGAFVMNVPGVARYRVEEGAVIVVDPAGGGEADVRTFLLGPVLAACLQQRGIVTLHASAVAVDGGAVLFAGGSGAGKSSLAAAFVERGYDLLADDVAGVVVDRERGVTALPAFPCMRLWEDALDGPGGRARKLARVRDELEKYEVPVERFHGDPLPVRAVFVLSSRNRDAIETAPLAPARAFESLVARTYRRRFLHRAGRQGHFGTLAALAGQAAVVRVGRPAGLPCAGALADELERSLRADARGRGDATRAAARRPALPRVEKPATVRRLCPVDAAALAARAARLSERAWRREDARKENRYPVFYHTRHVVFRFIPGNRDPRDFYSQPGWRVWRRWLQPLMDRVAAVYGFEEPVFPKAMLARLEAGQRIDDHRDGDGSHPLVHKVHIPLQTEPEAVLSAGGVPVHLAPGHAWEVNNLAPHGAFNGGRRDRIHFIFELFEGRGHEVNETAGPHQLRESRT